jgi:hypothetical protein
MTFENLWQALVRRNARLQNPDSTVTMTAANFRKALAQAYEHGQQEGRAERPVNDLFGSLFGR